MAYPNTPFPLLNLPRELREIIYEYTFTTTTVSTAATSNINSRNAGLLTSKRTRAEGLQLYYTLTTFTQPFHPVHEQILADLLHFFTSIPTEHRRLVKTVHVSLSNSKGAAGGPKTHALMRRYFDGELRGFERELFERLEGKVGEGVLQVEVFCWDGERERNGMVWTGRPVGVE
ncbi:hypothetical protein M409DRAFT_26948 [Zasmidium cellare ATCC 36951]|uniref:F-box domain-containing protein n=1 Tax=Zasmidium cellare ATCC 36951 TaxID=1080233 RepID=A0A6A6C6N9_ZASCE|nr:uncharacterized protein M409DRAFT_26948 [Zasmidium cellare ATCC 36951]KAF2162711.1 hypothetical protein M409DRAFT_26948 [Zasmidium cellare ATCC 36951]